MLSLNENVKVLALLKEGKILCAEVAKIHGKHLSHTVAINFAV